MNLHLTKPPLVFLLFTLFTLSNCDDEPAQKSQNKYEKVFKFVIIIGGYVSVIIGAVIFRMQARQSKVIQFQEVLSKGGVSSTQHKFEQLHEENEISVKKSPVQYEPAGGDSTKRKRRKRKADRLSDRRRNNENNQSIENNEEGED